MSTNIDAVPRNGGFSDFANNDIVVRGVRAPGPSLSVGNIGGNGLNGANANIPNITVTGRPYQRRSVFTCPYVGDTPAYLDLKIRQLKGEFNKGEDKTPEQQELECLDYANTAYNFCEADRFSAFNFSVELCDAIGFRTTKITIGLPPELVIEKKTLSECRDLYSPSYIEGLQGCLNRLEDNKNTCSNSF